MRVLDLRNPYSSARWNPLVRPYRMYRRAIHLEDEVTYDEEHGTSFFDGREYRDVEKKDTDDKTVNLTVIGKEEGPVRARGDYASLVISCIGMNSVYQLFVQSTIDKIADAEHMTLLDLLTPYGVKELEIRGINPSEGYYEHFLYSGETGCKYSLEFGLDQWPKEKLKASADYRRLLVAFEGLSKTNEKGGTLNA